MKRRDSSGTTSTTSTGSTSSTTTPSSDDPDRPTLTRRSPTTSTPDSTQSTSTASQHHQHSLVGRSGSTHNDAPQHYHGHHLDHRHHLHRKQRTHRCRRPGPSHPETPLLSRRPARLRLRPSNTSAVTSVGDLNADPNRPNLHHGKPTSAMTDADLPPLKGVPSNLHQSVAVSDAVNRDPHPFTLEWDDENQHQAILKKMQAFAQAQLAAYGKHPRDRPTRFNNPGEEDRSRSHHSHGNPQARGAATTSPASHG